MASLEAFSSGNRSDRLMNGLLFLASGAIGLWALRRYLYLLMHAEEVANQAVCVLCQEYGRFDVAGEDRRNGEVTVCCRKCQHQWTIAS
jgi:hypothetical protein